MTGNDRLIYLALGGAGEIGMNMYLHGHGPKDRDRFTLVHMGSTFPDMESSPGVAPTIAHPPWIQLPSHPAPGLSIPTSTPPSSFSPRGGPSGTGCNGSDRQRDALPPTRRATFSPA